MCESGCYGSLTSAQINNDLQYILDISLIKKELKTYLEGYFEYGSFTNTPITVVYGLPVYDSVISYVDYLWEEVIKMEYIDQRIFKLIYEHKNCMWLRIKKIEENLGLDEVFSKYFSEVLEWAKIIRMLAIKTEVTRNKNILNNIKGKLIELKEREFLILNKLLENI